MWYREVPCTPYPVSPSGSPYVSNWKPDFWTVYKCTVLFKAVLPHV